jgi:demethylphylloquinone reductase
MTNNAKVVVIGGGFGGLFTALDLAGRVDVTLITDTDYFTFRPLLYEYFSGEVEAWHIAPDYRELVGENVSLIHGPVAGIDFEGKTVKIANRREPVPFDALVLAVGSTTNYWGVKGAEKFALPFRDIADADQLRHLMTAALDSVSPTLAPQDVSRDLTFAVVGGGASGVELATKMSDLLRDAFRRRGLKGEPRVMLVEMGDRLVPGMGEEIRGLVEESLRSTHVETHLQTRVLEVGDHFIVSEHNGTTTETKTVLTVWTAGVRPSPLVDTLELQKGPHGLVEIEPTLQAAGMPGVFSLGDVARNDNITPQLAGTAQLAFQESTLAAANVRAFLAGEPLRTKAFEEMGEAVSLGTENAAVLVGDKAFGGSLARQARFALYSTRLPTWHHRLKVGASWFFDGTQPRPLQPLAGGLTVA